MNAEQASRLIFHPYVTEKTFALIERENKIAFIVHDSANKESIKEAVKILYKVEPSEVNTTRTIYGKKAFVRMKTEGEARDLATKLGLV